MQKSEKHGDCVRRAEEELRQAYDLLIRVASCERDFFIKLAEQMVVEHGEEAAVELLRKQAALIIEQSAR